MLVASSASRSRVAPSPHASARLGGQDALLITAQLIGGGTVVVRKKIGEVAGCAGGQWRQRWWQSTLQLCRLLGRPSDVGCAKVGGPYDRLASTRQWHDATSSPRPHPPYSLAFSAADSGREAQSTGDITGRGPRRLLSLRLGVLRRRRDRRQRARSGRPRRCVDDAAANTRAPMIQRSENCTNGTERDQISCSSRDTRNVLNEARSSGGLCEALPGF